MAARGTWLLFSFVGLVACDAAKGGLGQPCDAQPGASFGTTIYRCNGALVCNSGLPAPTCENPNADGVSAPCSSDKNCAAGLFCAPVVGGSRCNPLLTEGAPCPSGFGCAVGLTCVKVATGTVCAVVDAGGPWVTVDEAGSEAAPAEEGGPPDATSDGVLEGSPSAIRDADIDTADP